MSKIKVLGLGRLCRDEYYYINATSERVDSTKLALDFICDTYGGSVPRILSCLSITDINTHIISTIPNDVESARRFEDELLMLNIKHTLFLREQTAKSIVLFHRDNSLKSIMSVNESYSDCILCDDIDINAIAQFDPDCIVLDARHVKPAAYLAEWGTKENKFVFLDPGSSRVSEFANSNDAYLLLPHCHSICASNEFFSFFSKNGDIRELFDNPLFANAQLLICTLCNGFNVVATRKFSLAISRKEKINIGNSLGTGDIFRGYFLSSFLLQDWQNYEVNIVVDAMKMAISAATLHIQSKELRKSPPLLSDVISKMKALSFEILDRFNLEDLTNK